MELDLKDKVVLVTGGSKGIGLACAMLFASEGARVAICSRSKENVGKAVASNASLTGLIGDMSSEPSAKSVIDAVERDLGPIDILVNSAGAAKRTPVDDLTPGTWRDAMDAKYFSYINVIDPVIKLMGHRNRGVIVNIIGGGGKVASPIHLPGGSANAALMLATVGLANAYASKGVRVVGINPGLTDTDRVTEGIQAEARQAEIPEDVALAETLKRIPMGRMATPGEIAQFVVFLSSDRASYVTGINIGMDGAQTTSII